MLRALSATIYATDPGQEPKTASGDAGSTDFASILLLVVRVASAGYWLFLEESALFGPDKVTKRLVDALPHLVTGPMLSILVFPAALNPRGHDETTGYP